MTITINTANFPITGSKIYATQANTAGYPSDALRAAAIAAAHGATPQNATGTFPEWYSWWDNGAGICGVGWRSDYYPTYDLRAKAWFDTVNSKIGVNSLITSAQLYVPTGFLGTQGTSDGQYLRITDATPLGTDAVPADFTSIPNFPVLAQQTLSYLTDYWVDAPVSVINARRAGVLILGYSHSSDLNAFVAAGYGASNYGRQGVAQPIGNIMRVNYTTQLAITTNAASLVTAHTAQLNGTLTTTPDTCSVWFEYGLDTSYGITTASQGGIGQGATFNQAISGLSRNTTYHYRAASLYSHGADIFTFYGADAAFTTPDTRGHSFILGSD
jgi:hypothetical protein